MARLQILELPQGNCDDRPPYVLVVDQVDGDAAEALANAGPTTAELIGARAVLAFEDTIDIPANDPLPSSTQWELTVDGRPATWAPVKD